MVNQLHRVVCSEHEAKLIQYLADPQEINRYRQKGPNSLRVSTYFDLVLIEDIVKGVSFIIQLKAK